MSSLREAVVLQVMVCGVGSKERTLNVSVLQLLENASDLIGFTLPTQIQTLSRSQEPIFVHPIPFEETTLTVFQT